MENLALGGKGQRARLVDGLADFIASNFAGARAETDAAVAVHAANVRSCNANDGVLDGNAGDVFGGLNRFLNAASGFIEFGNDAFAQAARFGDAVSAIAQAVVAQLGNQHSRLSAADVNGGNEIGREGRHDDR